MEKINYMKKIVSLKSNEKAELAKKINNINEKFNLNPCCYSLLKLIAEKGYYQKNNKEIDFFQLFNNEINDNKKTNFNNLSI